MNFMSISKWTIFEYEYSLVEFVLSFVVAFLIAYYLIISLPTVFHFSSPTIASLIFGLIIGIIWTYSRAHGLFTTSTKKK